MIYFGLADAVRFERLRKHIAKTHIFGVFGVSSQDAYTATKDLPTGIFVSPGYAPPRSIHTVLVTLEDITRMTRAKPFEKHEWRVEERVYIETLAELDAALQRMVR